MEIFISHSSNDKEYGEALVTLLCDLGVKQNSIVFTSKEGFGIPKGQNIFNWLKSKLTNKPFVIYLLSDHYYSSIPCLNEMGAAWVIENDHLIFITPNFDLSDKRFREGAIDPREMVIFSDKEQDIFEFVDIIIEKMNISPSSLSVRNAVNNYMATYSKKQTNNHENRHNENKSSAEITYEDFLDEVMKNGISEEELLLVRYMSDEGCFILGDRWMAEAEVESIQKWESSNNLNNMLSDNYHKALSRFITREYLEVHSTTSHGNPREYIVVKNISKNILKLDKALKEATDCVINKYQLTFEDIF